MKKLLCLLTITACCMQFLFAQNKMYRYYFNEKLQPVEKSRAVINVNGTPTPQGFRAAFFETATNKLLGITVYTDSTLTVRNGQNTIYHTNGRVQEKSNYILDKYDGTAMKWDSSGNLLDSTMYANGKKLYQKEWTYRSKAERKIHTIAETDSINDTFKETYFDTTGAVSDVAVFKGNNGTFTHYKNGTVISEDALTTRENKDATFPGGPRGWRDFLERTINPTAPHENGAKPGYYTAIIQFTIDTDGSLHDIKALTNNGYGIENEAMRVIKASKYWEPAIQYGKKVKSYRKQPITFQIVKL